MWVIIELIDRKIDAGSLKTNSTDFVGVRALSYWSTSFMKDLWHIRSKFH